MGNTNVASTIQDLNPLESSRARARRHQREIKAEKRELERDTRPMIRSEMQALATLADLKKRIESGDRTAIAEAKDCARSIAQYRREQARMRNLGAKLDRQCAMEASIASTEVLAKRMNKTTKTFKRINQSSAMTKLPQTAMEFSRQSEMAEAKQEMAQEAIDDATANEEDEEIADEMVNKILDEAGLNLEAQLSAPDSMSLSQLKEALPNPGTKVHQAQDEKT